MDFLSSPGNNFRVSRRPHVVMIAPEGFGSLRLQVVCFLQYLQAVIQDALSLIPFHPDGKRGNQNKDHGQGRFQTMTFVFHILSNAESRRCISNEKRPFFNSSFAL
jgi:hypothetical protein